jgi:starch synthase
MAYGSIPIGRKTGGLADTIRDIKGENKNPNGFLFENASSNALLKVIHRAIKLYQNQSLFKETRKNSLNSYCSWDLAAKQYGDVYKWALKS